MTISRAITVRDRGRKGGFGRKNGIMDLSLKRHLKVSGQHRCCGCSHIVSETGWLHGPVFPFVLIKAFCLTCSWCKIMVFNSFTSFSTFFFILYCIFKKYFSQLIYQLSYQKRWYTSLIHFSLSLSSGFTTGVVQADMRFLHSIPSLTQPSLGCETRWYQHRTNICNFYLNLYLLGQREALSACVAKSKKKKSVFYLWNIFAKNVPSRARFWV